MKYQIHKKGIPIYQTELPPSLRLDEDYILIDESEPQEEFETRLLTNQKHTVNTLRLQKRREANSYRDKHEQLGFSYLGKVFESDTLSVQRITIAVLAASTAKSLGIPFEVEWTCADGSTINLTADDVIGMPLALANQVVSLHVQAKQRKESLATATFEELEQLDYQG